MQAFLIKTAVNGVALWVAALAVPGIHLGEDDPELSTRLLTIALVALVFGVLNAFIKPILSLFSIPFIILTLGLFTLVLNAFMLQLTEWIAQPLGLDFTIDAFWWDAVIGAIVITLVSMVLNVLLPDGK
ncbi:phage holin family protein [Nostocoides sp. F2B08]|uniref:phage holin family protein n=1 Tax=Nostocoides sp. F2B08 TaxID=2653936 RepID=UPI001262C22A|nr:phage holin family protein [Tetrasphaera sp. F2B08]KAB7743975.1 phage holin family protein [Tetrasphaera sp. F2B08]